MPSVTIDGTWITAAVAPPFLLSADNTIYTLAVDVDVASATSFGELFRLTGKNVVLELNGHTVRQNGVDMPQVTDSEVYRRVSEYTHRVNNANPSRMFGGKYGTGTGKVGVTADVIPAADKPLLVPWARTD